ncbi:Zn-ribbon domain-containing OB-fold protein [Nonomuraea harbinensis]|uniref:Zn-ribbon domain-containing OB-fold protein n=1 Tax=Nonomuraea harbinensis TaxID=1286938 RepID=A0ABW1CA02_9ACTN|nr:OB-fold domain-containing protein [Nonomuraea harbinensis]
MIEDFMPRPTPETAPYWEAAKAGELRIQKCGACGRHYFYPRPFCRYCASPDVAWVTVSGRARLVSYVINRRPMPGFESVSPVIALVELDEGPRLMTNVVGVEPAPENLPLDLRLRVTFEERGGTVLPVFQPEEESA